MKYNDYIRKPVIYIYMYIYVNPYILYMYGFMVCVNRSCTHSVGSPEAGIIGSCESPDLNTGVPGTKPRSSGC